MSGLGASRVLLQAAATGRLLPVAVRPRQALSDFNASFSVALGRMALLALSGFGR
jgi:hypothetical protein